MLLEHMDHLWPNCPNKPHIFADATLQQLIDFQTDHGLTVEPAMKHDKDATLATLRTNIQEEKIIIDPKCSRLIYQLENGVWNEERTKWLRSSELGHCDGVAALGYFVRMARWRKNPWPKGVYDPRSTFDYYHKEDSKAVHFIRRVFSR